MFISTAAVFIGAATFACYSYIFRKKPYVGLNYAVVDSMWRICIVVSVYFLSSESIRIAVQEVFVAVLILSCICSLSHFLSKFYRLKNPAYFLFVSTIGAPVMEEVLFRGFILHSIHSEALIAIIASSILFGIYHIKNYFIKSQRSLMIQIIYAAFIVGPVFAWVTMQTSSIFFVIVLHSINNAIAVTITQKYFGRLIGERLI